MHWPAAESILRPLVEPVLRGIPGGRDLSFMVVGAVARDALHVAAGNSGSLRRTSDLDLALAVPDLKTWYGVTRNLDRVPSSSGIRFSIAGRFVDLVPFGDIEDPRGTIPREGDESMSVFAFREVWAGAQEFSMADCAVRLPDAPGFAVLKMKTWADRSSSRWSSTSHGLRTAC